MPDGIKVRYPNPKGTFTFLPFAFPMVNKGTLKMTRLPASAGWKFVRLDFKDDPHDQFKWKLIDGGESIEIEDKFLNEDPELYYYTVTIRLNTGEEITSPDPVIVNDPGDRLGAEGGTA